MGKMNEIDQRKLADFISTARTIRDSADVYLKTDGGFRRLHHLPSACMAGKSAVVLWLWPRLFEIWRWSGKRLAKTPGGPLHRFVSSVHAICERQRNGDTERLGCPEVDHQLDFRGLLDRQVDRLVALQNAAGINAR